MARPTKYTPELIKKARNYLKTYKKLGDMIPSIAGLACELGISRETVRAWGLEPDKAVFSGILDEIRASAERVLVNNGLSGDFNSNIAKLVLGKHGYHEKKDVDSTSTINITVTQEDSDCL